MVTRRHIIHNENGAVPIIETLIAVGISVVLLTVFFTSAINFFTVYDRPDIDLNAKSIGIMEMLLNSPGQGLNNNKNWEEENWEEGGREDVEVLGLGTSQTVEYGILQITDEGEVIVHSRYSFSNNIGVVETCFLTGTKVLMADDLYKNIEEIDVGDFVRSYDEETDKLVAGRVTKVFHYSPEEMISDYYLVINDQLRVTPSHRFYSNGEWIYARDLKIGDILFHSLSDNTIYSIEKIFEKRPVYDLEVAVHHTYFVAMDTADVLVHNQELPTAEFTWFDCDGLRSGAKIIFDASSSEFPGDGGDPWYTWWWDWAGDEADPKNETKIDDPIFDNEYTDDDPHVVRLLVNDTIGDDSCIYTVQANNFDPPDIAPGTETDLAVYPEIGNVTFTSYDENHYVKYTGLGNDYYLYEIKEKTNSPYTILDYQKITGLTGVNYPTAKSALGFSTQKYSAYNFNIAVSADSGAIIPSYGASYAHPTITALYSSSREVVIYHPPTDINGDNVIDELPYYENGRITVRVFIGGADPTPNYPPYEPRDPNPADDAIDVPWNKVLSWLGGDPNGVPVTYDVYFGTTNPPPKIVPGNQSGTMYDPGIMVPDKTYYWKIRAWDPYDANTTGPIWEFTTESNSPPYTPHTPNPSNGTANVDTSTVLSWTGGDPDEDMGDTVTYDVLFGTKGTGVPGVPGGLNLVLISDDQSSTSCNPSALLGILRLEYNKTYCWKIVARDSRDELTAGPIWTFTTAEKGLDQYNTEGSGEGLSTWDNYLGQTFTAGRTGNLTNIKLSLKFGSGGVSPEYIIVVIYKCDDPQDPEGTGESIANTTIPSFEDDEFTWKNAIFDEPVHVDKDEDYFIVINRTTLRTYNWQYSLSIASGPGEAAGYPDGMPYKSPNGRDWERAVEIEEDDDFLFKTYVFREPERDQYCDQGIDAGVDTNFDLAQTFIAGRSGDLMKVNLSLKLPGAFSPPGSITVEIYDGLPEESEENMLANTTIEDFNSLSFVWTEANFSNPPCLEAGTLYFIVVKTVDPTVYLWKTSIDGDCYSDGTAWLNSGVWTELPFDFIFETYMDDID